MRAERHAMLQLRARLRTMVREYFAARDVLEVETPMLSAAGNTEPNIEGFETRFTGHVDAGAPLRYLRTSPEYPLKRLLAEGLGDCYEMGRVFRNGEAGRRHNPEFTMLEWYRVGLDERQLARETIALVQAAQALAVQWRQDMKMASTTPVRAASAPEPVITTYRDLFGSHLGLDPFCADLSALRAPLAEFDIQPGGLTRDDWLDLLLTHRIQCAFPADRITVIHDWPASQCALARIRPGEPPVAERFELYLGGNELANGYHELNDTAEQRRRFAAENAKRRDRGQPALPVDENLLAILDQLPDCAGVALGVERLLMSIVPTEAIAEVMAYPFAAA